VTRLDVAGLLAVMGLWVSALARADSLATPELMDPSCRGHEQNRITYLRELELVVNGGDPRLSQAAEGRLPRPEGEERDAPLRRGNEDALGMMTQLGYAAPEGPPAGTKP